MKIRVRKKTDGDSKELKAAEEAVQRFDEMREELETKREEWESKYPEANSDLEKIVGLEEELDSMLDPCKDLVRKAGRTIGGFVFQAKKTSPGYKGLEVLESIANLPDEDAGRILKELYDRGFFKNVKVDNNAGNLIRASGEDFCAKIESAWDSGGKSLTPAITAPKF